ncbi:MAG: mechanosensitive ion channel family protein [Gemmatimonadetes bacterium]|nr:MAG: mechanosensitive ion channel family protein [Gemmatimonadota bacterium]
MKYPFGWIIILLTVVGVSITEAQETLQVDAITRNVKFADTVSSVIDSAPTPAISASQPPAEAPPITKKMKDAKPVISIPYGKIFWATAIFILAFFLIQALTQLLEAISERWTNLRLTIKGIIPVFRILAWMLVIYLIITRVFSPPVETLLAVGASTGLAVGFASQDILKNIFGGIMILFDRPFQVGDKIEINNYYGEVKQIGLRSVRIVTPDDSLVSIPNGEIMNQSVSNANAGESNCQVVAEIYLPAHIDLVRARKLAYRAAAVSRYIYLNKPIRVIFKNEIHQGRSIIKMRLKAYVFDIRYEFPFMSDMTETIIMEFLQHNLITPEEFALCHPPDFQG